MAEQNSIEQKVAATPLKRDVTPYEIAKYLQDVLKIGVSSQTLYRLRKEGRFPSENRKVGKRSKWFVKKDDATKFILEFAQGSNKSSNPAW